MDRAAEESLRMAALLGSAGRYGLFPSPKPFELSVNINGNALEVVSLSCHGITKSGCIIDIDYDSNFANTFDTRIAIPSVSDVEAYYLVLKVHEDQWREINETYSEMRYSFELVAENSPLADNCMPIGLLVNRYGWRLDETEFVPPCLYVAAHPGYAGLRERATVLGRELFTKCLGAPDCAAKLLLTQVWTSASAICARLDKERDTLTPGCLLASLQQLVSSFLIGCFADSHVSLENLEPFAAYALKPFDAKNTYRDIEAGLNLCAEISAKMTSVCAMVDVHPKVDEPKPAPKPEPVKHGGNRWSGLEI